MMSTQTQTAIPTVPTVGAPRATRSGIVPYRLTVRQFDRMIETGVFRDEDHVELRDGILVDKMKKNEPHNFGVGKLGKVLGDIVEPDWFVREEKSLVLGRFWNPEPDVAVVRGLRERYRSIGPKVADIGMLTEVADTTYAKDRGPKWRQYAAARIPVYGIVNVPQRQVEV